jgi:hypothetical protein
MREVWMHRSRRGTCAVRVEKSRGLCEAFGRSVWVVCRWGGGPRSRVSMVARRLRRVRSWSPGLLVLEYSSHWGDLGCQYLVSCCLGHLHIVLIVDLRQVVHLALALGVPLLHKHLQAARSPSLFARCRWATCGSPYVTQPAGSCT